MGTGFEDTGNRGGVFVDVGELLLGGGPGGYPIWVFNVNDNPPHGLNAGRVPEKSVLPADTETTVENNRQWMVISSPWGKRCVRWGWRKWRNI